MKQKIFTPEFAEELKCHVVENISNYINPTFSWEKEAEKKDAIYLTDLEKPD